MWSKYVEAGHLVLTCITRITSCEHHIMCDADVAQQQRAGHWVLTCITHDVAQRPSYVTPRWHQPLTSCSRASSASLLSPQSDTSVSGTQ
jgi:hypothetical protein